MENKTWEEFMKNKILDLITEKLKKQNKVKFCIYENGETFFIQILGYEKYNIMTFSQKLSSNTFIKTGSDEAERAIDVISIDEFVASMLVNVEKWEKENQEAFNGFQLYSNNIITELTKKIISKDFLIEELKKVDDEDFYLKYDDHIVARGNLETRIKELENEIKTELGIEEK